MIHRGFCQPWQSPAALMPACSYSWLHPYHNSCRVHMLTAGGTCQSALQRLRSPHVLNMQRGQEGMRGHRWSWPVCLCWFRAGGISPACVEQHGSHQKARIPGWLTGRDRKCCWGGINQPKRTIQWKTFLIFFFCPHYSLTNHLI